jgi:cysteine desulfurase
MKRIYMDYAAATPLDDDVLAAMRPFFAADFYNPSATYLAGRHASDELDKARATVAQCLGARASEIVFTAGGTEANNLAIRGVMERFPDGHVVVSAIEHDSVLKPAEKYSHSLAPVDRQASVDLKKLAKLIRDNTVLVSVMFANNEVGTIQPLKEISQLVAGVRQERLEKGNQIPLYLHTDACQAGNYLDLHVSRLGIDLMTINGGKLYGPKQSGALYVKAGIRLEPIIYGGGQEYGLRSGTENVAGAVGLAAALEAAQAVRKDEAERVGQLQKQFIKLLEEQVPEAVVNGSRHQRLPNNVHLTLPGRDNERLMMQLDEKGIICAVGSACSASNDEPSHVLKARGLSDKEARASLRFTLGRQTTLEDIETTVRTLADL